MSELASVIVEGVVLCDAVAAACRCHKPVGHDGPHACDPRECTGQWRGDLDGDGFAPVVYPRPVVS